MHPACNYILNCWTGLSPYEHESILQARSKFVLFEAVFPSRNEKIVDPRRWVIHHLDMSSKRILDEVLKFPIFQYELLEVLISLIALNIKSSNLRQGATSPKRPLFYVINVAIV